MRFVLEHTNNHNMGNAPLEAYEQSQQDLLNASRKFYYDTLKCIGKATVDDEVLKSLRKTSQKLSMGKS